MNISRSKETDSMVGVALHFSHDVEGLKIWLAAMIDKSALIPIVGRIDTDREEAVLRAFLKLFIEFITFVMIIHIEKITHS